MAKSRKKSNRKNNLKYSHQITASQYDKILADQDFRCAICQKQADHDSRNLSVDHDHLCCPSNRSCGNCIRGLLCTACNMGLGHFKDSIPIISSALRYLRVSSNYVVNEVSLELLELEYSPI